MQKEVKNLFQWAKDVVGVHCIIYMTVGHKQNNKLLTGVGNANTFGFTCSWLAIKDGENIMRIETKDNSYLVWLDR